MRGLWHVSRFAILVALVLSATEGTTTAQSSQPTRILLEAEQFSRGPSGWSSIAVGEGNYFVDAIGAGHYSGGRLARLEASLAAEAWQTFEVPQAGPYRVWARYEFPWRIAAASFRARIEQQGRTVFEEEYGKSDAIRHWFFSLPDAPWHDLLHGVEGPVSEAHDATLEAGQAVITLIGRPLPPGSTDRNVDFIFLTSDLTDRFRSQGERLYPILDEIGRAAPDRTFIRVTNPAEAGNELRLEAQYTLNRAPWRVPAVQIGPRGSARGTTSEGIAPGASTPWMNLTCPDTTHSCHLHLRARSETSATPLLEISSLADESGLLRRLDLSNSASETIVSIPPYPALEPERIVTLSESLQPIVDALEASNPAGHAPQRFLVYAGLGGNTERHLDQPTPDSELAHRLFFGLGVNAFNNLDLSALSAELSAMRKAGSAPPRWLTYGDYRWSPTDDRLEKATREIDTAGAGPYLRGFTLGDEIKLSDWFPRGDEGDAAFRRAMQDIGESPGALGATHDDADAWAEVRLEASAQHARDQPRLFVRSRQFQQEYALGQIREAARRIRGQFGDDILVGANFTPHPSFRPDAAQFVRAFRAGGLTRASHSDYWWQASEMGPESTGFILDAFRAGLRGGNGVIQPYVMPHSPGNSDRDAVLGIWAAITHGATAIDLFRIGPEQLNTENYIHSQDLDRFVALKRALYALGPVEDVLLEGKRRPATAAIVLSDSTDLWESVTSGISDGAPLNSDLISQLSTTERKGIWQALRHDHIPVDMLLEEDLTDPPVDSYSTIYLVGPQIRRSAAEGVAAWVERGGTLVAVAGAGSRDEFDQPFDLLNRVLGTKVRQITTHDTFVRPRIEAPRLAPLDAMTLPDADLINAVASIERFDPLDDAVVLARFHDGSPAALLHSWGRGSAVLLGAMPGTAYLRSAAPDPVPLPDRGPFMHQPLINYDHTIREIISRWSSPNNDFWPRASSPLVSTGIIETPERIVVPLANYGAAPVLVSVEVPGSEATERVWSVQNGDIPFQQTGATVRAQVPLDLTDFLVIERRESAESDNGEGGLGYADDLGSPETDRD